MTPPRFGVNLSVFEASETVRLGLLAEKLRYDSVWIADHLIDLEACKIDPWVALAGIGAQTSRTLVGTAVTDAQRIHPAKLAQMAASLDELTRGRVILGLGSGEKMNLVPFGLEWTDDRDQRILRLVEAVKIIRLLWSSDRENPISFDGEHFHVRDAWLDGKSFSKPYPKIYVGALHSPKLLRATGEIADGWLDFIDTPELFERKVSKIREGASAAGRSLKDIDVVAYVCVAFTKDKEALRGGLGLTKLLLASERYALRKLKVDVPISDEEAYIHCIPNRKLLESVYKASQSVPDEVAKRFVILGDDPREARMVVDEFVARGATHFQFLMLAQHPEEMMREFSDRVLSTLR
jgi:phthiodiolone/phenolphthiodiolone dimycocerosates ketoreductase